MKKDLLKVTLGLLLCGHALVASAALSFSESVAGSEAYAAPVFNTATPALAYEASDSLTNVQTEPLGAVSSFLVVQPNGSATVDLGGVSSFSFLWGSPDLFNSLTIATSSGSQVFSGLDFQSLFGLAATGDNANTRVFSILAGAGELLNSITFASSGIAFELAVATSPVPEPQTYALMLAGLAVLVYLGWRARSRD